MSPAPKLVLFDIDGTLLWSHGAGRRAMEASLRAIYGCTGPTWYRYDGKTDQQIVRELMRAEGFDDAAIDARMGDVVATYLVRLREELAAPHTPTRALRGVPELLDALATRDDRILGLLTGNVEPGAALKLGAAGIDAARFPVGAFGSDHEERDMLPAIAQRRARERLGHDLPGESLVIIGDTPNDVACGRGVCARAIAVATGHYSTEQLAEHEPAAVFADLRDTAAVLAAIDDA